MQRRRLFCCIESFLNCVSRLVSSTTSSNNKKNKCEQLQRKKDIYYYIIITSSSLQRHHLFFILLFLLLRSFSHRRYIALRREFPHQIIDQQIEKRKVNKTLKPFLKHISHNLRMSDSGVSLDELRASVARQGAKVREIKKAGNEGLAEALEMLKKLKLDLAAAASAEGSDIGQKLDIDRNALDMCLVRRMFVVPSFEIYGGVRGFYTYGPPGCALKANLLSIWRQHFVLQEKMQEVECTNLMPKNVLESTTLLDQKATIRLIQHDQKQLKHQPKVGLLLLLLQKLYFELF